MDLALQGRRVVVTGGSRGLGRSIVRAFRDEGADVLSVSRTVGEPFGEGPATVCMDLTQPTAVDELSKAVQDWRGGLDILICNVGSGRSALPGAETAEDWRRALDVNLYATVHAIEAVRGLMLPGGVIICISSITGRRALGAPVAYSAAKAAIDALVINLARPLGSTGVRILGVAPGNLLFEGSVWQRKLAENADAVDRMLERDVPLGRLGAPEEIANLVVFLASDRAAFMTGAVVVADGGQTSAP